jgi:hypothetical protein
VGDDQRLDRVERATHVGALLEVQPSQVRRALRPRLVVVRGRQPRLQAARCGLEVAAGGRQLVTFEQRLVVLGIGVEQLVEDACRAQRVLGDVELETEQLQLRGPRLAGPRRRDAVLEQAPTRG